MAITGTTEYGNGLIVLTVDADPRSTAVDAPSGSVIVFVGTDTATIRNGDTFRKLDDGSTTNVSESSLKNSFAETTDPGVSDDNTADYQIGSLWINVTLDKAFICLDAATGAAVWTAITSSGATDADAIHDNVAGEIVLITEKTTLVDADLVLIEDSADSNNKKRVQVVNLPGGGDTLPVVDTTGIAKGSADATKIVRFEVDGLTTGTTRVLTVPDEDITLVGVTKVMLLDGTQAMTGTMTTVGVIPAADATHDIGTDAVAYSKIVVNEIRPSTTGTPDLLINRGNGGTWATITNAGNVTLGIETQMADDVPLSWGAASDAQIVWDTAQTNDHLILGVDSATNLLLFTDQDRIGLNFTLSTRSTPTFYFHDGTATLTNLTRLTQSLTRFIILVEPSAGTFESFIGGDIVHTVSSVGVAIAQIAGSDPINNTTGLDSRKLGFEVRLWDGAAPQTRTGFIRFEDVSGINDQGTFTFSSNDNGGAENDFFELRRNSNASIQIRPSSSVAFLFLSGSGTEVFRIKASGGARFVDNSQLSMGTGDDNIFQHDTAQTNHGLLLGLAGTEGNYFLITDKARIGIDRGLAVFTNPTLVIDDGGVTAGNATTFSQNGSTFTMDNIVTAGIIEIRGGTGGVKLQHDTTTQIEINSAGIGLLGATPASSAVTVAGDILFDGNGTRTIGATGEALNTIFTRKVRPDASTMLQFFSGPGVLSFQITTSAVVEFNPNQAAAQDTVFMGDTDAVLLTADSGLDRVGVGVALNAHLAKFHVAGGILGEYDVEIVAATPHTVTSSEPRRVFTNEGATAQIVHTLPTATAGLTYTYIVQDTDGIRVDAATGDTLRIGGTVSATAGRIEAATIGDVVTLVAINATEWIGFGREGTWTVDGGAVAGWLHSDGSIPLTASWDTGAQDILTQGIQGRPGQTLSLKDAGGTEKIRIISGGTVEFASLVLPFTSGLTSFGNTTKQFNQFFFADWVAPDGTVKVEVNDTGIGFFASAPVSQPTIAGVRQGNPALADLLADLDTMGLINDTTTAGSSAVLVDGSVPLTANWDTGAFEILTLGLQGRSATALTLSDAGGTARVTVASDGDLTVNPLNDWTLQIGGSARVLVTSTSTTFNSAGADHDHIFQGDNDATLVVLNGGVDRVGIGVDPVSIEGKLIVEGTVKLKEQTNAELDTLSYGQFWVRDDNPNTPMFTDDLGTDFVLNAGGDPASSIAEATGDITTTSATDVLVTTMTITPASGTYLVWFTGSVDHSANNGSIELSIYSAGSQVAASERSFARGAGQGNVTVSFACSAKVTVNGSQAIEGQWRTPAATATMHERTLKILKVA